VQLWGGWRSAARTVACCSLEAFLVLRCADGVRAPAATQPRDAFACAVWLLRVCMKAKTTCKRTREVKKKTLVFPPTTSGTTLGMGEECTFRVEDGNLSDVHAVIGLHEDGQVYLKALGRTYFLIGVRLRAHTSLCTCRGSPCACRARLWRAQARATCPRGRIDSRRIKS
jgi:hypothetical protein